MNIFIVLSVVSVLFVVESKGIIFVSLTKGPVTQAPITRMRTKTKTIKMHALDWLNERGCILPGAIQPVEGVHLYHSR